MPNSFVVIGLTLLIAAPTLAQHSFAKQQGRAVASAEQQSVSPAAELIQARTLLSEHRNREALELIDRVLVLQPEDLAVRKEGREAAVGYALELRNFGQGEAALACLQHAAELQKTDSVLWMDVGIQADALQHFDLAYRALTEARRLDPGSLEALYGLARVETDRGRLQEAATLLREYLQARPEDATAHYGLGSVLVRQQQEAEAATEFERSIRLLPAQTESYYQLGQMALNGHRDVEAKTYFSRTLARMPSHGGALTGMGIAEYRSHDYAGARRSLEAAVVASPAYQPAHYYLGLTLARLGEVTASTAELDRAKTLAVEQQGHSAPVGRADGSPP